MLAKIKSFFQTEIQPTQTQTAQQQRLACAALLIEVALVDEQFDDVEMHALFDVLHTQFGLETSACEELYSLAKDECHQATSTYQFTQLVNLHCTNEQKFELIKGMWKIAYADNNLDKYEEAVIRKVAELIYVSHSDFIRAKLNVREKSRKSSF